MDENQQPHSTQFLKVSYPEIFHLITNESFKKKLGILLFYVQ